MSWKLEIEKILRDQMPYAFPITQIGKSYKQLEEGAFAEALGYVLDHIENLIEKKAFFDGYVSGGLDTTHDINLESKPNGVEFSFNSDISRVGAERAWLKRGQE